MGKIPSQKKRQKRKVTGRTNYQKITKITRFRLRLRFYIFTTDLKKYQA
jgi:hypothetical protein